ncbi:imm11 family protein [Ruegeria atlantica]|uniref:imm11 family protein n=1 Tax=Ruegeria atlantica TaxID=81569 RepID=UPI002493D573|nr:DUF1629 domain-containing protein [Ruegeria atlantica]
MPWILDVKSGNIRLDLDGGYSNGHNPIDSHGVSGFVADIPPDLVPFRLDIIKAPEPLPEFASYLYNDIYVGETARRLIEELEPSVHQFYETIVTRSGNQLADRSYFRFQIGKENVLDGALVVEESDVSLRIKKRKLDDGSVVERKVLLPKVRPPRMTWRKSVVQGRHLWTEKRLRNFLIASDELYAAFKSAGVTGFNAQECRFF